MYYFHLWNIINIRSYSLSVLSCLLSHLRPCLATNPFFFLDLGLNAMNVSPSWASQASLLLLLLVSLRSSF